jgi:hypothetical protein
LPEVNKAGLLDDIRNAVTLPAQVWEIASALALVDKLRREHEAVPDVEQLTVRQGSPTPVSAADGDRPPQTSSRACSGAC